MKNFLKNITLLLAGLILSIGASYVSAGFNSAPASLATNTDTPIHVGGTSQSKSGGLSINEFSALQDAQFDYDVYFNGIIAASTAAVSTLHFGGIDGANNRVVNLNLSQTLDTKKSVTGINLALAGAGLRPVCADQSGNVILCPVAVVDVCANITGNQATLPTNAIQSGANCTCPATYTQNTTTGACLPPSAPTATLTASPTSITSGSSSTLTWTSANSTSCTGTGFTAGTTSNSTGVSVSPTTTTTYTITCTGAAGTTPATSSVTVTVTAAPTQCGNSIVDSGEECDFGPKVGTTGNGGSNSGCTATCTLKSLCGAAGVCKYGSSAYGVTTSHYQSNPPYSGFDMCETNWTCGYASGTSGMQSLCLPASAPNTGQC